MKNQYVLNPGEFYVAQELIRRHKNWRLYHPLVDTGTDLLVVKDDDSRPVRIQIKESRVYHKGHSWHQVRKERLRDADVFVFVVYSVDATGSRPRFVPDFLIIPQKELEELCARKKANNGKYSFYFKDMKGNLWLERREKPEKDVSIFHDNWELI